MRQALDRDGRNLFGYSLLMASRLVEVGVSMVQVNLGRGGFDTHGNAFDHLKNLMLPPTDQALSALIDDLDERGLLDDTLIVAAGEAKAGIVRAAVEEQADVRYPAAALHVMPQARLYVTQGAAKLLAERKRVLLVQSCEIDDQTVAQVAVDLACGLGKKVVDLPAADFAAGAPGNPGAIPPTMVRRPLILLGFSPWNFATWRNRASASPC